MSQEFETIRKRREDSRNTTPGFFTRYKPQIVICALFVLVLAGGAYHSSRVSESAPQTVYSTSLDEAKDEAQAPLLININTAEAKDLEELPGVGPSTAENIIEHRRHGGKFKSVDDRASVANYKSGELRFRALVADSGIRLKLVGIWP